MIVVDMLLAANLIFFVVCALRAPWRSRTSIDELYVVARTPSTPLVQSNVPSNVVPFVSRQELTARRARAAHPTAHVP